jgi:hypothetical protein
VGEVRRLRPHSHERRLRGDWPPEGPLGKHADAVYRGLGGDADQQLAKRIFLELVQLGEGSQDTRRRVDKEALLHLGRREQVEALIALLASQRLVSTSGVGASRRTWW